VLFKGETWDQNGNVTMNLVTEQNDGYAYAAGVRFGDSATWNQNGQVTITITEHNGTCNPSLTLSWGNYPVHVFFSSVQLCNLKINTIAFRPPPRQPKETVMVHGAKSLVVRGWKERNKSERSAPPPNCHSPAYMLNVFSITATPKLQLMEWSLKAARGIKKAIL